MGHPGRRVGRERTERRVHWPDLAGALLLSLVVMAGCEREIDTPPPEPDDSLLTLEQPYTKQTIRVDRPGEFRFRTQKRGAYLIVVSDNPKGVPIRIKHPKRSCSIIGNGSCELVSSPDETYDVRITTDSLEEVEYTLTVSHTEGRGLFQGDVSRPVTLAGGQAHGGAVGVKEASFYSFKTDTSGSYTISVTGAHSNLLWRLFDAPMFDYVLQECDSHSGAGTEACKTLPLHPNTRYYVKVEERSGVPGDFDLRIFPN